MRKLNLVLSLGLLFSALAVNAQDATGTDGRYVATNVVPIFRSFFADGNVGNYSLAYWKQANGKRFRFGGDLGFNFSSAKDDDSDLDPNTNTSANLSLYIASENLRSITPRVLAGFGPIVGINAGTSSAVEYTGSSSFSSKSTTSNLNAGLFAGVLGSVHYQALPWLLIGADARLVVSGAYQTNKVKTEPSIGSSAEEGNKGYNLGLNFLPISSINVAVRF